MGYRRHHAIVITSCNIPILRQAHEKAEDIFGCQQVSPITPEAINGYRSFLVGPDGSKEGWAESDIGNQNRDSFIHDLKKFEASSWGLSWVEVQYGDDNMETKIIRDSDQDERGE